MLRAGFTSSDIGWQKLTISLNLNTIGSKEADAVGSAATMDDKDVKRSGYDRDSAMYLELSDKYGWQLYSYLSEKTQNPKDLPAIYEKAMRSFYKKVCSGNSEKELETVLFETADQILRNTDSVVTDNSSGAISKTKKAEKEGGGFLFWLAFLLLLLLNVFCLWAIVGLLMNMGFLPVTDLGYSWFHENVAPLFW